MKKRIISILLVLCSLLALLPAGVSAAPVETASGQRVNPMYGGELSDRQLPPPPMPRSTDYMTEDEAVEYFREQLVARETTVTINYTTTSDVSESANDLFNRAVLHTGNPTQGDYIYWQWGGYDWSASYFTGAVNKVTMTYQMRYYTTAQQEQTLDYAISDVLTELDLWNAPDYEKVAGIYDYICDNVVYDDIHLGNESYKLQYTAYAAMVQGTAVCQGYALLFYRMALELGVDTRFIAGIGNGDRHGWNIVRVGGLYYNLDSTWDAGSTDYSYYLRCPDNFYDHYRDDEFETAEFHAAYPMATTDFDPASVTPLAILQQPKSVSAASGATARVTLKAQGDGLTYKWYFANQGESKFTYTTSFKGNSYGVTMNESRAGRRVYCVVADQYGNSIKSNTVTLSMSSGLRITSQPVSVAVAAGKTAKVTVTAQGEGLTYKWYYRSPGSTGFKYTSSFKGNSYSVTMNDERNGRQLYCVITDKYGNSVKTNTVTISQKVSLVITQQPKNAYAYAGKSAKVTVGVQGDGLTFKWYFADKGSSTFTRTTTFGGNSYTVTMNDSRNGRRVYCVITDQYGNSVKTKTVTLTQMTPLKILSQPTAVTVANGKTAKATLNVQGDGLTFQWFYANATSGTFTHTTAFGGNSYAVTMNAARNGRKIFCVITDKYGNSVLSNIITLKMK